jgi:methionyl aminopeptidase
MIIKNKAAIAKMRTAGHLLAQIMLEIGDLVKEGVSTLYLDEIIEKRMRTAGLRPECKGYAGYQYATCISLNDIIVHGVPSKEVILKSGDFVKIDVVGSYKNYCADITRYFFVGQPNPVAQRMASVAQRALDAAINKIAPGVRLSEISLQVQQVVEAAGFGVVRDFAGHGIGRSLHEDPSVPNYVMPGQGLVLVEGMTLAIEPMITERSYQVRVMADGWTARTVDGGLAAHVEDTIAVTTDGVEILTRLP